MSDHQEWGWGRILAAGTVLGLVLGVGGVAWVTAKPAVAHPAAPSPTYPGAHRSGATAEPTRIPAPTSSLRPAAPTPKPTARATPKPPKADHLPIQIVKQASPDGQPSETRVQLAGGEYSLRWEVYPYLGPAGGCGVTINLFDPDGDDAGSVPGVSTYIDTPHTKGDWIVYRDLPGGTYTVFGYVGCPWSVEIDRI